MSEKIKPSFKVNGKNYEFIFTRYLQLEYQKMVDEKKRDSKYQQEIAEYKRLQEDIETLKLAYDKARAEWIENPSDKEKLANYNAIKDVYVPIYKEFVEYTSTHDTPNEADAYVLKMLGDLTLLALQEQYKLSEDKALEVWNKFVEDSGQQGSMEWLAYLGKAWLTDIDEEPENPFIKAMREKSLQANNRRAGISKIKK